MISWCKVLGAVLCALFASAVVRADMVLVTAGDVGHQQQMAVRCTVCDQPTTSTSLPDCTSVPDFTIDTFGFCQQIGTGVGGPSLTGHAQIITDGQSSLSLCLSALIGLGLCSSAHCLKKLHFGFIPEWYHSGGPFQIGHSIVVNPDSICPAPAYCFVQPVLTAENPMPISRLRNIVSLWRESQYTPEVLFSRGPPNMS